MKKKIAEQIKLKIKEVFQAKFPGETAKKSFFKRSQKILMR